jgi:hypothetical protein
MSIDSTFGIGIGLLVGLLWSAYHRQTGQWLPAANELAGFMERTFPTRTGKAAVCVTLFLVLHVVIGQRPALAELDRFAFWMTVVLVGLVLIDPWIDPRLRRLGIRK